MFILLFCGVFLSFFSLKAEGQNKNLADGNPPLTSQMVERFAGLMEWSLDLRFSSADREAVRKQLVNFWQTKDEKNIKAVLDMLAFEKNLASADEAKKRELQPQVKRKVLEALENDRADALNRLLLEIYNKNLKTAESEFPADGGNLSALVGKWQVLHGNSIYGADIKTGKIGEGNAMIAEYDIRPDGRVIFSFVLQQTNFGCTTRVKTSKTGRASVSGSRVTFAYEGGTTVSEDNCNRQNNYTKKLPAEKETFDFRLERSESGKTQFCFANAKLKDCAVKVK
jgi:hypothetical protein